MNLRNLKNPRLSATCLHPAIAGRGRQLLPGGDELRRAPECVTTKTPEYATLEGLIHRDSSEYVTKKIMCAPTKRLKAGTGG